MINCIIIDDEQAAINIITNYLKNVPFLNLVATTTNAVEGLHLINNQEIDLVFLDIQMPEMTGLELIKTINGKSKIIIISAYSEFALDGFELEVIDYLLKPVPLPRFLKAVQKAKEVIDPISNQNSHRQELEFIVVQGDSKGKFTKIEIKDIDYIEGMRNYVAIHTGNKKILSLMNMKNLEDSLPNQKFIRVHKSFIVAIEKIASIDGNSIKLKNNDQAEILIGNAYKSDFLSLMKARMIQ